MLYYEVLSGGLGFSHMLLNKGAAAFPSQE